MTTWPDSKSKGTSVTSVSDFEDLYMTNSGLTNISVAGDLTISTADLDKYYVDNSIYSWSVSSTPFENYLPPLSEVLAMCEEYPGLAKAYENFKTAYQLVEQDWKGKQK